MLDINVCKKITELVEVLSTSGKDEVDKKVFRELATNAGQSEAYLKFTLEKLFHQLERKHSEIRLGAFLVIDLLFMKSEYFRELLLDEFHVFLELTVESNPDKALPPPIPAAKKLKQRVLQSIHKWNSKFQESHKRLALSYNFLKHNLKVDFADALKRNAFELQQDLQERERRSKMVDKKVDEMKVEMEEKVEEISRIVTEMNNGFALLVPKPDELFQDEAASGVDDAEEDTQEDSKIDLREHGIVDRRTVITVQISDKPAQLKITEDNAAIFDSLKDQYLELKNGYLPLIKKWVQVVSKKDDATELFRRIMDIKGLVEEEMRRFEGLSIGQSTSAASDSSEESDSDFEDVPDKEGYEEFASAPPASSVKPSSTSEKVNVSEDLLKKKADERWQLWNETENDVNDPTSLAATLRKLRDEKINKTGQCSSSTAVTGSIDDGEQPGTSSETRKQKLLKCAPKLPYDIDLYHWEDEKLVAPSVEIVETDGHKFWTPAQDRAGEVIENPDGIASLRTRVIEFTGKFEPVKWSCRAPLPSGRLCPRKDRVKCPLHGKIVARDDAGNPVRPEDIAELEAEKAKAEEDKPPDWQDPEFLKDIEAQTGMDLTIRKPQKGKKKKSFAEMYPSLTDIDKKKNNSRARLEKKVLNRNALKRVASAMDSLNHKRFKDKFGDQWNYSMNDG